MVERTIVWTETAARQRREILKYWTKRNGSPIYAEKLIKLIAKQTKLIAQNPLLFKKTNYPNTHESAMGHFSIYYQVTTKHILISAFWDNRQDPKKLAELLKK